MTGPCSPQVVVSAGFNKTHVTTAAHEAWDRGLLALAITGAYPTGRLHELANRAGSATQRRLTRLAERDERLPEDRLKVHALPELLCGLARAPAQVQRTAAMSQRLCAQTFRVYGRCAGQDLGRLRPEGRIYHFRAGFGGRSIPVARERGMSILCDHAIVHPAVLDTLIMSRGQRRTVSRDSPDRVGGLNAVDRVVLADIDASDQIVVNSDFVKRTFLECHWPGERIHVVYLGVDENFLRLVSPQPRRPDHGVLRMLFAGRFERRKGADVLAEALPQLDFAWELVIAGPITREMQTEHRSFLADPRVRTLGSIPRAELARAMAAAAVFVFPSYAEGSARVVFEALASACLVITTPNSGTIVEDGVHGALVAPGDVHALVSAIAAAAADRRSLAEIGNENAALIRKRYRQRDYGDALAELYREIVDLSPHPAAIP